MMEPEYWVKGCYWRVTHMTGTEIVYIISTREVLIQVRNNYSVKAVA